jgi:hypothetical protein
MRTYKLLVVVALGVYHAYVFASMGGWLIAAILGVALPLLALYESFDMRRGGRDLAGGEERLIGVVLLAQIGITALVRYGPSV